MTYLDTSALGKLLVRAPETSALAEHLAATEPELRSSELLEVEVARLALRVGIHVSVVAEHLADVWIVRMTPNILARAKTLEPGPGHELGTLDAIHLASALEIGETDLLTYDRQLAAAARHAGLTVIDPR